MFFYYRLLAGTLVCLLVIAFQLLFKWRSQKAYKSLLGLGLMGLTWFIFVFFFYLPRHVSGYEVLFWCSIPIYFLPVPLFYLYIQSHLYPDIKLDKKKYSVHLLPILLVLMFFVGSNFYSSGNSDLAKISHVYYVHTIQFAFYVCYQWFILCSLALGKKNKRKSNTAIVLNIAFSLLLAAHISVVGHLIKADHNYRVISGVSGMEVFLVLMIAGLAVFCFWFFYQTEDQVSAVKQVHADPIPLLAVPDLQLQRSVDWLPADLVLEDCCQKLELYMTMEKPWLQQRISLQTVAAKLDFTPHILSAIVNKHYLMNYNDFINKYRIQYIHEMVKNEPSWRAMTLESIALEAGFASRTACYNAFKKYTGMSLGNYIETLLNK